MVCSRDIHAGLGDNTVLGGPIEVVVKCIISCIGRTLRCAEIVEVCLGEGDDFTANFPIDKEIEGEVFVIEGVGPTEGVLGIHVAEVFVGLSIEFEWSSGLRVDNDFSGYFVSHKVDGIEVAIRTAFFEFDFQTAEVTHIDFVDIFLSVLLTGHREDFVVVVGVIEVGNPTEIVVGSEDIRCG